MTTGAWARTKTYRELIRLLKSSGLSYEVTPGTKHMAVYIDGIRVLVLPQGPKMNLDTTRSAIRRAKEKRDASSKNHP